MAPFDDDSGDDDGRPRLKRDKQGFLVRSDKLFEFDCPECDANNPWPDGFADGEEVECHYCGRDLRVVVQDGGKLKFKLL